jgi:hypothetical protein
MPLPLRHAKKPPLVRPSGEHAIFNTSIIRNALAVYDTRKTNGKKPAGFATERRFFIAPFGGG